MSREVKRVALDFDWPLKKVWPGYVNPFFEYWCGNEEWDHPMYEYLYDQYNIEPPEGEGWQMWETVSDGSPISPVFKTPEALALWLVHNSGDTVQADASYEDWLSMIHQGWAPTMVSIKTADTLEVMSGVKFVGEKKY